MQSPTNTKNKQTNEERNKRSCIENSEPNYLQKQTSKQTTETKEVENKTVVLG